MTELSFVKEPQGIVIKGYWCDVNHGVLYHVNDLGNS